MIKDGRMVGNTTRIIDNAIQTLFTFGRVVACDHYNSRESDLRVFQLILQRLHNEHGWVEIKYDRRTLKIELVDKK